MSVSVLTPPTRGRVPWWFGPLIAIVTILLTFVVLEVVVRVAKIWVVPDYAIPWYQPTAIAGVPYGLKPNLNVSWGRGDVRTNAEGLRDDRPFTTAVAGATRILAVGDSITFGFGVDQGDSFPARLERALNARDGAAPVEVVNAGVNGYSLRDTARRLPSLIERYRPTAIIWTLVPNDYDDSFAAGADGLVVRPVDDNAFSSTSEFALGQDATKPVDFDDYRRSMTDAARHWADGTPLPPDRLTPWLERSYLFRWIRSLVNGLPIAPPAPTAHAGPLRQNAWTDPAGRVHPFPAHVALFSHATRLSTFNRYLDEVRSLAASHEIPLVVVNTNLPIESRHRLASPGYAYYEASVLLDQPFVEFHSQNSLRWDPHFSPDGNERFARALLPALACSGIPADAERSVGAGAATCAGLAAKQRASDDYWRAFDSSQRAFASYFRPAIDFDQFAGLPQVVGGIYPPREFPNAISHRAELLLAPPSSAPLHVDLTNPGPAAVGLTVTLRGGGQTTVHSLTFPAGRTDATIDLPSDLSSQTTPSLLEVSLACDASACATARLHYVGSRGPRGSTGPRDSSGAP